MILSANTATGVWYGCQTLLQMLRLTAGQFPRGWARDWPAYRERRVLLDAGRKYWSVDYLLQTIRELAYLRLNSLQLHFCDNIAFRLDSDRFPGLAADQSYSREDIRRLEQAARRYHVRLIPEIELPAHTGAILDYRPDLRMDLGDFWNPTLDVTNPEARAFAASLIGEFAPWFAGPEFHIAADEYPRDDSTADVFVEFINELNRVVRSLGKRMVIWNWWDVDQHPTIRPDRDITIQVWTTAAETHEDHGTQSYLDQGYRVIASPSDTLYVTPGGALLPDPRFLYEEWQPLVHPRLAGYQLSVWADSVDTQPDDYFDAHLHRPRQIMADRLWGGPRIGGVEDFYARVDAIGPAPKVA